MTNRTVSLSSLKGQSEHVDDFEATSKGCQSGAQSWSSVFALDSVDNAHLVELGTIPVPADDPRA